MRLPIAIIAILSGMTITAMEKDPVPQNPTAAMSPNARSFQRYGDIPVSLYTGTPSINIPLATLREGELSLPIELSYHSGGIKADEHPGWTGLGWTLIAGGAITREVRDIPDESRTYGYRTVCSHLKLDNLTSSSDLSGFIQDKDGTVTYPMYDTEPDKFSFQFPGYSGYFMMGTDGEWHVFSDRPLQVNSDVPSVPSVKFPNGRQTSALNEPCYKTFILTADDGTEYIFGKTAVDYSINSMAQSNSSWEATAWYLVEIRGLNGQNIVLDYERGDFVVNFSRSVYRLYSSDYSYGGTTPSGESGILISPVYLTAVRGSSFSVVCRSSTSTEQDYSGEEYTRRQSPPQYQPIFCPSGNGTMKDEVNWRQLDEMIFYDSKKIQTRRVKFGYSHSKQQRLTLQSVEIREFDNTVSEKYGFVYKNISQLPEYLSYDTDHWGFYGCTSRNPDDADYKEPLPEYAGIGVLTEIIYPTGGRTILEFEPHQYSMIFGSNDSPEGLKTAGGVRIKRIVNIPYDGSNPEIREYLYGGGILEGKPIYRNKVNLLGSDGSSFSLTESASFSLSSLINNFGFHISYPSVTEKRADSTYTVTSFMTQTMIGFRDEAPMQNNVTCEFVPHSLKGQYRGKVANVSVYSNKGHCVRSTNYTYGVPGESEKWVNGMYLEWVDVNPTGNKGPTISFPKYSLYRNYMHSMAEIQRTECIYEDSRQGPMTSDNYKRYNSEGQLSCDSTVTNYSNGRHDADVTSYRYQWENDRWYSANHVMTLLSDVISRSNGKVVSHIKNTYSIYGDKFPTLNEVTQHYDGSDSRLLYTCALHDKTGLPVHVIDASGLHTVYLWGADRLMPVAEIKNADAHSVRALLGYDPKDAPDDPDIQNKITMLRRQLPDAMITSYTYTPYLGVTSITDPAAETTYYDYDWQKRLIRVRDMDGQTVSRYYYNTYSGPSTDPQSMQSETQSIAAP